MAMSGEKELRNSQGLSTILNISRQATVVRKKAIFVPTLFCGKEAAKIYNWMIEC